MLPFVWLLGFPGLGPEHVVYAPDQRFAVPGHWQHASSAAVAHAVLFTTHASCTHHACTMHACTDLGPTLVGATLVPGLGNTKYLIPNTLVGPTLVGATLVPVFSEIPGSSNKYFCLLSIRPSGRIFVLSRYFNIFHRIFSVRTGEPTPRKWHLKRKWGRLTAAEGSETEVLSPIK